MSGELVFLPDFRQQSIDLEKGRINDALSIHFVFDRHATAADAERKLAVIPDQSIVLCEGMVNPNHAPKDPSTVSTIELASKLSIGYYAGFVSGEDMDEVATSINDSAADSDETPETTPLYRKHNAALLSALLKKRCLIGSADWLSEKELVDLNVSNASASQLQNNINTVLHPPSVSVLMQQLGDPDVSDAAIFRDFIENEFGDAQKHVMRESMLETRLFEVMSKLDGIAELPNNRLHELVRGQDEKIQLYVTFGTMHSYMSWVLQRQGYDTRRIITSQDKQIILAGQLGRLFCMKFHRVLPETVNLQTIHQIARRIVVNYAINSALAGYSFTEHDPKQIEQTVYKFDEAALNSGLDSARKLIQLPAADIDISPIEQQELRALTLLLDDTVPSLHLFEQVC